MNNWWNGVEGGIFLIALMVFVLFIGGIAKFLLWLEDRRKAK